MSERWRVFDWFSYSHWGMFRLPLFNAPDWFVLGSCQDVDDEDIEVCNDDRGSTQCRDCADSDGWCCNDKAGPNCGFRFGHPLYREEPFRPTAADGESGTKEGK